MKLSVVFLVAACISGASSTALAGQVGSVRVSFANGRVTVIADNATVGDVLREWARVGGSTFVNAEKISAADRLTLRLEDQPELQAIEVLLRSVAGYVVAPQRTGTSAVSTVGRVLIMPGPSASVHPVAAERTTPFSDDDPTVGRSRMPGGPPRPDDDGPVRIEMPPVLSAERGPVSAQEAGRQNSPLQQATTHASPGVGIVTSPQPGVVIGGQTAPPGVRPVPPPPKPKPGGGGG